MLQKLRTYLLQPYSFAFVLSVIVIIFLPEMFNKYEIRVIGSGKLILRTNTRVYCYDLDHDGFSEQIYSYDYDGKHSLQAITYDGGVIDQWNTAGSIIPNSERLVCGDYDKDGFDEVYTFFQRSDTIFMYCFEPMDTISPILIKNKPVCTLCRQYAEPDAQIFSPKFQDINGDGKGELLFVVLSGFAKFPRNIFIYDIFRDSLLMSHDYGSILNYGQILKITDLDNDGKKEICGGHRAQGHVPDSLGYMYSDYNAWLMVFDHKLNLLFDPLKFKGFLSTLDVVPVTIEGERLLACFYNHEGRFENYPKLFLVNGKGEIMKEHKFPKSIKIERTLLITKDNGNIRFNIFDTKGHIKVFNHELQLIREQEFPYLVGPPELHTDLNNAGRKEFVFVTSDNKLFITDADFKHPAFLNNHSKFHMCDFSVIMNGEDRPSLFLYSDDEYISIQYHKNPLAPLRFVIYFGIYFSILLFIVLIRKLQLIQIKKQESIRNQIVNLQLKGFRNQIDPHFTFNVFNTIASMIRKENPKTYPHFIQFSKLIRNILESSDKITRTLEEEINYLESYLELEKLRFSNKFDYSIKIENNIDISKKIPKMILQTYVENAIKHGIRYKEGKGLVSLEINKVKNSISFDITDDGIGREKAKKVSKNSTGFGLKIMDNYFKLFNEYNDTKIKYEIIDLFDEQNIPAGTKVRILIPLNFSYKLKKHGKG